MGSSTPQLLLVGAVFAVGILHTIVPDHWLPIAVFARAHRWSPARTARAALFAGLGHTLSTLILGAIVWIAGVAMAQRFGHLVSTISSVALIAFGGWVAITSLREIRAHEQAHVHKGGPPERASRSMTLLFILGSSPMVEGLPAFFAAGRYGAGLIAIMSAAFAFSTIATYVVLCVSSVRGLQLARLGRFERYGEVVSGAVIALIGIVFLLFPVL
ncbi:MAG: hypothetical protein ACXWNJ_06715 [Vulcanimicrobiaceae bacterium]